MENIRENTISGSGVAVQAASTRRVENSPRKPKRNYRTGKARETASAAILLQVIQQALVNGLQAGLKISQSQGVSESSGEPFLAFAVYGARICGNCHAYYLGDVHDCPNGGAVAEIDDPNTANGGAVVENGGGK